VASKSIVIHVPGGLNRQNLPYQTPSSANHAAPRPRTNCKEIIMSNPKNEVEKLLEKQSAVTARRASRPSTPAIFPVASELAQHRR